MKKQQIPLFNIMDSQNNSDEGVSPVPIEIQETAQAGDKSAPKKTKKRIHASIADGATDGKQTDSMEKIYRSIVLGLRKYFTDNHFKRAALGLSGGVDSSLTLKLAVEALGPEVITAFILPELGVTKQENTDHAKALCEFLGVEYYYQPINNFLLDFKVVPWKPGKLALMNTKARLRAVLLYSYANTQNAIVLGTSNKSELLLGYGTKYGDLAADIEVIGDLYKTEVIRLADYVGLPPEIVNKTPTAELDLGQTDEEELGASYQDLDKTLMRRELGLQGCVEHGLPLALVQNVFRRMEQNKHKTELPFVINAH